MEQAPKTRGRKIKFEEEGRKHVSLTYSQELERDIQLAAQRIRVMGHKKRPRPMLRAEFLREGARALADLVMRGKYRPVANRPDESPIAEVLSEDPAPQSPEGGAVSPS